MVVEPHRIAAVSSIDKLNRDRSNARHMSTNRLLSPYMKKGESRVKFAGR